MDEEVKWLYEALVRTCTTKGVALTGFLFSAIPPLIMHFSNVVETGPELEALHAELFKMLREAGPNVNRVTLKP